MVSDLNELIASYEVAKARIENLIESGSDSEPDFLAADKALSVAFKNLLQSDLTTGQQSVQRLQFLLGLIKENQPGNLLIERLADKISQDVQELDFSTQISIDPVRNGTH